MASRSGTAPLSPPHQTSSRSFCPSPDPATHASTTSGRTASTVTTVSATPMSASASERKGAAAAPRRPNRIGSLIAASDSGNRVPAPVLAPPAVGDEQTR